MIQGTMTHPQLLAALAGAGHGTKVLIADGNYPVDTGAPPDAVRVYLNLRRGLVTVPDVLAAVADTVPLEAAEVMVPEDGTPAPIVAEFEALLPAVTLERRERFDFYQRARARDVGVVVATGESRTFANILLTIGVVHP